MELQESSAILRELSNTMAEERADERLQIAGYLHDDLAQVLFRLSLQVDVARKLIDKGDVDQARNQLDKIRDSKQETSDRIRALIAATPDLTLAELRTALGVTAALGTLWAAVAKLGFTVKKKSGGRPSRTVRT